MKILTKQQFIDAVNSGQIDIRPTNICYINKKRFSITVEEFKDEVRLKEI